MENKNSFLQKPTKIYADDVEKVNQTANIATTALVEEDFIPQSVYDELPSLLKDACNMFNDKHEKDIFLLGALAALGGAFHNLYAYNDVDKKCKFRSC